MSTSCGLGLPQKETISRQKLVIVANISFVLHVKCAVHMQAMLNCHLATNFLSVMGRGCLIVVMMKGDYGTKDRYKIPVEAFSIQIIHLL